MSFRLWFQRITTPFLEKTPSVYAACAVFYFLISILPTSAFLLSVLYYFPEASGILLKQSFLIIPEPLHDIVSQILVELVHTSTPAILSISGILSLWSSSKGIQTLANGLKHMMDVQETGNWIRRRLKAMMFFLLILFLLVGTTAIGFFLYQYCSSFSKSVIPVSALFIVLLSILYRLQSFREISYSVCLIGACAASIAVFLYSYAYGIYIRCFSSYDDFWGNLGAIVLGMMWFHGLLILILIGSRFSKLIHEEKQRSSMGLFRVIFHLFK